MRFPYFDQESQCEHPKIVVEKNTNSKFVRCKTCCIRYHKSKSNEEVKRSKSNKPSQRIEVKVNIVKVVK